MLTPDVRLGGFDAEDWTRLVGCFGAGRGGNRVGGVIAVHDGNRLRKLLCTNRETGELESEPWPSSLADLRRRHRTRWAGTLHVGALDTLMERVGERTRREDDLLDQVLLTWRSTQELGREGQVRLLPATWMLVPAPTREAITWGLDWICPDRATMALGVRDGEALWTGVAMRRRGACFDHVTGPEYLRHKLVGVDWSGEGAAQRVAKALGGEAFVILADRKLFEPAGSMGGLGSEWLRREGGIWPWAEAWATGRVVAQPHSAGIALAVAVAGAMTIRAAISVATAGGWAPEGLNLDVWGALRKVGQLSTRYSRR